MKLLDCVKKLPLPQRHATLCRAAWEDKPENRLVLLRLEDFDDRKHDGYVLCRLAVVPPEDVEAADWYISSFGDCRLADAESGRGYCQKPGDVHGVTPTPRRFNFDIGKKEKRP